MILDEAHTMLKRNKTGIFKTLDTIRTKRRIALTGTPLQNNLLEYYNMASWCKPGCLGTEREFERNFNIPIIGGMTSNCSKDAYSRHLSAVQTLHQSLAPFVQRKDANVLARDLPKLQQVIPLYLWRVALWMIVFFHCPCGPSCAHITLAHLLVPSSLHR